MKRLKEQAEGLVPNKGDHKSFSNYAINADLCTCGNLKKFFLVYLILRQDESYIYQCIIVAFLPGSRLK